MFPLITSAANWLHYLTRPYTSQIEVPFIELSAPFYNYVRYVDSLTNLGEGAVIYMTCLFLSFPLALIQRKLPRGAIRHLYSVIWGLLFTFLCFGWLAMHSFVPAVVAYISMLVLPSWLAARFVFLFAFVYLSIWYV
jgi:hypothetical protein